MLAPDVFSALLTRTTSRRPILGGVAALGAMAAAPSAAMALGTDQPPAGPARARAANELYPPLFDPVAGLAYLPQGTRNSWFLIGYLETAAGHKFNCLVHQIINSAPGEPVRIASILNITDITDRKYHGEERIHTGPQVALATDRMKIVTPTSTIEGDHRTLHAQAAFDWGALAFQVDFPGHIMMNGGAGIFAFVGGTPTVQYSIPWGKGTGWLMLDGVRHQASGAFWFDRQWGVSHGIMDSRAGQQPVDGPFKWTWMDLNLSNGIALGLWDLTLGDQQHGWVTALLPDGTHVVAAIEPLANNAAGIWTSPASGQRYPTRFTVKVPALDCVLDVTAVMAAQEIVSPTEPKYEGVATISGTYAGEHVTGFTLIEMVGNWRA
jgi:predicted secreted hydrolase